MSILTVGQIAMPESIRALLNPVQLERKRLAGLDGYGLFGSAPDEVYREICQLACTALQVSHAVIALLGEHSIWIKAVYTTCALPPAIEGSLYPRQASLCERIVNDYSFNDQLILKVTDHEQTALFPDLTRFGQPLSFCAGVPLISEDGLALGALYVMHDQPLQLDVRHENTLHILGKQVMARMELHRSHQLLQSRMAILQDKTDELEQLNHSQKRFLSVISHDLRAPFQGILGFSELLITDLEQMSDREINNVASYIHDAAQSTYRMLDNLLSWSQLASGHLLAAPVMLPVDSLMEEITGNLQATLQHKQIQLRQQLTPDLRVYADPNLFRSIMQNLISNAIKFSDSHDVITIAGRPVADHQIQFSVQDTGVGMTAEQVAGLFQNALPPSERGTKGEAGSGLGLKLCEQFIKQQGGHIWVESVPGKGTDFHFTLPATANWAHGEMPIPLDRAG